MHKSDMQEGWRSSFRRRAKMESWPSPVKTATSMNRNRGVTCRPQASHLCMVFSRGARSGECCIKEEGPIRIPHVFR